MKIFAIESSAKAASVAVCLDGELLAQYFQNTGLTHSKTLLKMAEDLLLSSGMNLRDFDAVAVARGPGSFTGIRIGVSAAIGLSWGSDLPVCGVSTLEAMAHLADAAESVVCPVMDARREQVYNALFLSSAGLVERRTPDRAISVAALIDEAKNSGRRYYLLGDGAVLCRKAFLAAGVPCVLAPPHLRLQNAWGVACAAQNAPKSAPGELVPVYLRVSQAERERLEKETTRQST
jgi:tRNA threonylcarbamoyladenosine biosynthesis protein TsaB